MSQENVEVAPATLSLQPARLEAYLARMDPDVDLTPTRWGWAAAFPDTPCPALVGGTAAVFDAAGRGRSELRDFGEDVRPVAGGQGE